MWRGPGLKGEGFQMLKSPNQVKGLSLKFVRATFSALSLCFVKFIAYKWILIYSVFEFDNLMKNTNFLFLGQKYFM